MAGEPSLDLSKLHAALAQSVSGDTHKGAIATDSQLKVVSWNRWMEIHSGHTAGEVRGRSLLDVYPGIATRGMREYYEGALDGRVTIVSYGLHRFLIPLRPTNADLALAEMPQSGRIGPLTDGAEILGTLTLIEDVSERLASEAELRKRIEAQQLARGAAEKALRAKDEFLSTLSHEIRTPLNAVLGWARILLARDDIDRALLDRALHVIERNAAAQAKMIDDMLDMARVVAGKLRLEMQPVDLFGVVLAAVDVVMPSANAKRIAVRTSLDPRTPHVLGDPDRLQQVIWNLLSNALKFTQPGGAVDVRLDVAGRFARIVVSDAGQGIDPDFLPYVFERFRQNDASSARRHGGLGLGLALVRELVELHGGTVSAASDGHDKGASFTIDLPTGGSPEVRRRHMDRGAFDKDTAPSLAGVRVLVVEDESDARDLIITALEECGAQVSATSSGPDGVSAILSASPDTRPHVLVSDIGMPGQDGYDFIRQVRSLPTERAGRVPAVAVTGYATPEDVERAHAAGFQLHVSKPIDPSALVSAIAQLVRGAE